MTVTGDDLAGNEFASSWSFTTAKLGMISGGHGRDGNAITGATVTLSNGPIVTTDQNGYFMSTPPGTFDVTVSKDDYQARSDSVTTDAREH